MKKKEKKKELRNELEILLREYIKDDRSHRLIYYNIKDAFERNNVPFPIKNPEVFKRIVIDALAVFQNKHRPKDGGKALEECLNSIIDGKGMEQYKQERRDVFGGSRSRKNYRGRQRTDLWEILEKAYDIVTFQHIKEWEKDFGINKLEWAKLSLKLSESFGEGGTYENIFHKLGFHSSQEIDKNSPMVNKIISEHEVLWAVYEMFKNNVTKAIQRKNADDMFFLKRVGECWGDHAATFLGDFKITKRGKPVSKKIRDERFKIMVNIIRNKKERTSYPALHTRIIPEFLCLIAYYSYKRIFINVFLKSKTQSRVREELIKSYKSEIEHLQHQLYRAKEISNIQILVNKYNIRPHEIQFTRELPVMGLQVPESIKAKMGLPPTDSK